MIDFFKPRDRELAVALSIPCYCALLFMVVSVLNHGAADHPAAWAFPQWLLVALMFFQLYSCGFGPISSLIALVMVLRLKPPAGPRLTLFVVGSLAAWFLSLLIAYSNKMF